jgi:hypothetical protein
VYPYRIAWPFMSLLYSQILIHIHTYMTPMESTAIETTFSPPFEDHVSNAR